MADQNDGFSEPDPAPIPSETQTDGVTIVSDDVSCTNCIHFSVCAYYAGIAPMLEQRENAPIEPDELAVICEEYSTVEEMASDGQPR